VAATPPPATVAAPVETERPPIQEILSAAEATRLLNEAVKSRQEINQVVEQLKKHHLSRVEVETKEQAVSLSKLSEQAQKSGDMRKASELAVKGLVLAKALLDGK
jgi:predicted Holliday junction resolvase-like endonuclease